MSGASGIGGAMGVDRVMALRAQILERNEALSRANASTSGAGAVSSQPTSFADTLTKALGDVNSSQQQANALSDSYERGETIDIAKVMMARQEASVNFEATLQVRNKLLSAYQNIMSMPV
jgi:flagellar hook-basal body complex protein FliE